MVDALNRDRIKVDQTLHGYSEGHRLIDGSFKLPQPDARTMLVLSDASGSGSRIPFEGYLTGYPLPESGKYALARTWAAPEMSRPGCVWTHSLLIDFADLARLGSAEGLLKCFRRPAKGGYSSFTSSSVVEVMSTPTALPFPDLERAGQWATALYGKPKGRIIAERKSPDDDELVVAIWMQQWPRLRRTFRFCSFSTDDRSTSAGVFDIQLMDVGRSSRSRIPGGVIASAVERGDWVDIILDDLEQPTQSSLRQFLRDVGSDVTAGRAAMVPLIRLYVALKPNAGPSTLANAVADLERLGPGQGRMGRAAAARVMLSRSDLNDRALFEFALQQVRADRELLGLDPVIVGRALLRWKSDLLADDMAENDPLHKAFQAALPGADPDELVDLIKSVPGAVTTVLGARPEILEQSSLWQIDSLDKLKLIGSLDEDQERTGRVIDALVDAGRSDCSTAVVGRFGIHPVVAALSRLDVADLRSNMDWVRTIASQTDELAECMADGRLYHRPLLLVLAEILEPDAVPNSVGTDPWVIAVERTEVTDDVTGEDLLAAFLFSRAKGWQSRSVSRLFSLSVQRLHEAMATTRLTQQAWRIAKPKLPYGSYWRDWDQCEKLRHAVVDSFIDHDLPPIEFGTMIDDGKLWSELVELAADTWRGRRYLKKVSSALRGGESLWVERANLIDRKIK